MQKSGDPENEREMPASYVAKLECRWRHDLKITMPCKPLSLRRINKYIQVNNKFTHVQSTKTPFERNVCIQKVRKQIKYDHDSCLSLKFQRHYFRTLFSLCL